MKCNTQIRQSRAASSFSGVLQPQPFLRTLAALSASLAVSACVQTSLPQKPAAPAPAPAPVSRPAPPIAEVAPHWRDGPLTPGDWTYRSEGTATVAAFESPQGERLLSLACHRERGSVSLVRSGAAAGPVPATILTTFAARPYSIAPITGASPALALSLRAKDPVLDEIAFSRGRFALEVNGLPTLFLPVYAEIGRVIEDCR